MTVPLRDGLNLIGLHRTLMLQAQEVLHGDVSDHYRSPRERDAMPYFHNLTLSRVYRCIYGYATASCSMAAKFDMASNVLAYALEPVA